MNKVSSKQQKIYTLVSKFEEIMTSSLQQTDKVESAHYFLTLTESSESYFPIFVVNIKEELYFSRKSILISCQLCPEWLKKDKKGKEETKISMQLECILFLTCNTM